MRKICLISDGRTSHGIYKCVLDAIKNDSEVDYLYILTGMHISKEFGNTADAIKEEGYNVTTMDILPEGNERVGQAAFIGKAILKLINLFKKHKPDVLLIQGDRGISIAAAIVGAHMWLPVAHMHGGEVNNTIDDSTRHAITKYTHLHFPSSEQSAKRLERLGEDLWRIYPVGSTSVEYLLKINMLPKEVVAKRIGFDPTKEIIVVLFHPTTKDVDKSGHYMQEILGAIEHFSKQTIVIYPNSDAGCIDIISAINESVQKNKNKFLIKSFKNIDYKLYLSLLKYASVLIGNSSGGIIEAPSLGIPVVNIGSRQDGREKSNNIIDVGYNKEEIIVAINKALYDKNFLAVVSKKETPYIISKIESPSKEIVRVLKTIRIDDKLLDKRITY